MQLLCRPLVGEVGGPGRRLAVGLWLKMGGHLDAHTILKATSPPWRCGLWLQGSPLCSGVPCDSDPLHQLARHPCGKELAHPAFMGGHGGFTRCGQLSAQAGLSHASPPTCGRGHVTHPSPCSLPVPAARAETESKPSSLEARRQTCQPPSPCPRAARAQEATEDRKPPYGY